MPILELEGRPDLEGNPREMSGEVIVGSGSQAGWRITGQDLAARHFRVRQDGDAASVVPASPQNVVVLNGKQVPASGTELRSGDVVAAGSARFVYLASADAARPAAAPAKGEAHLIDVAAKKGYTLRKRVVQIGREIGCSIVLKDPTVSRFHADVRSEGGEFVVYSMGSAGTKINGAPSTQPRMLEEGDEIQIGDTTFTFTRNPIPTGIRHVQFEDHDDDSFSRKNTQLAQRAVTMETGRLQTKRKQRSSMTPYLLGGAVAAAVVVLWIVLH